MKTPDEIKKWLECCTHVTCNGCPYDEDGCATSQQIIDALDYIQQLENQIGELTEKVAQLEEAQPKWISVKEKLPENDDNYLVFTSDKYEVEIANYYGDCEWITRDLTNWIRHVTHWMPIPQMPKEDA